LNPFPPPAALDWEFKAWVRRVAVQVPVLRSAWQFASFVRQIANAQPGKAKERFDRLYDARVDPWDFTRPEEQARHRTAAEMLDKVRGRQVFCRALEVGCGEGVFTQILADKCEHLLAVDVSPIALSRARSRASWGDGVEFRLLNVPVDRIRGKFDLIVAMEVLPLIRRPWDLKTARDRIVAAIVDGGYLLIQNHKGYGVPNDARWAVWLVQGGPAIDRFVAHHQALEVVVRQDSKDRILTLFRKRGR
jgi:SAM-dependent methyltransferase